MKILFFTHYYTPEGNAPASRVSALAERWTQAGHQVTVVTGVPNVPNGIVYDGYRNRFRLQHETINGVQVVRVWTFVAGNRGVAKRMLNFLSYMFSSTLYGLFARRPDIMIATSPQFFCGWTGVLLRTLRRIPFVLEIRDIWPESINAVDAKIPGLAYRILCWMERMMYRSAQHIVTVGPEYAALLKQRDVPEKKISIIMNGVDKTLFYPRPVNAELRRRYGLEGKFVCSYIGTIGMACGLATVLTAARILKDTGRNDIVFLLIGDGAERENLQRQAQEQKLDNIIFTGRLPKKEIPDWIASSDVNLVHLKKNDLFRTVMPSKIFESAGCAKPLLIGVEGFARNLVLQAEAGIAMEPENAAEMVKKLTEMAASPELCEKLGKNAFNNIAAKYDRDRQAAEYAEILRRVVQQ